MNKTVKHLITLLAIFCALSANGQVGIGTAAPDASAQLEISSKSKGVLIPRMTLAQREDIEDPANGLLVYQTNTASGFYYYNNGQWQRLASSADIPTGSGSVANSLLNGPGNPTGNVGNNGDFYINTTTHTIYGPKSAGLWPVTGVPMAGSTAGTVTSYPVTSQGTIDIGNGTNAALSPLTLDLADDAVTAAKIANGSVGNAHLNKSNIPLSGFAPAEGTISLGGNRIINLATPTGNKDAATKKYVDDLFSRGASGGSVGTAPVLSLDASQNLSIQGGNSVSLADLYQSLSLSGTILSISGPRNSHVDLLGLLPKGGGGVVSTEGAITGTGLPASPLTLTDQGIGLRKIAPIPAQTFLANNSGFEGSPTPMTFADLKAMLSLTKADLGLGNVDNTADANKNVSSAARLTNPRRINGELFDGSADIIIADHSKQPADVDLEALAGLSGTGIIVRTANGAASTRTLMAGTGIDITNGNGVNGNPAITLSNTAVIAGNYTSANISVDSQGRITAASNGTGGSGGGLTSVTTDASLTGNGVSAASALGLADNAVTAAKILNGAVTTGKIQDGAVTAGKIADGSIAAAKITDGAITDAKISTVSGSKVTGNIAGNAANVTGVVAIANGGTGATTQNAAINALLPAQAGQSGKILQTDGLNATWVAAPSGGSGGISSVSHDATLTGSGIAGDLLGLADNAVTVNKIANGAVTDAKIGTVSASKITGTLSIANGGTGASTAAGSRTNLGLGNVDNTSDASKPISTATQAALNIKEDLANKSTDVSIDGASDTKYPSVKAAKKYVDDAINAAVLAGGGSGGVISVSASGNNGITATVSNPNTNPSITIGLGAITPTSVTTTGAVTGSNIPAGTTVSGTNTGDQTITLTGDVTGSGTGSFPATIANNAINTAKIANNAVTYAKLPIMTSQKLLGSGATGTAPAEITLGTGLSFSGNTLNATGGSGTIASNTILGNNTAGTATATGLTAAEVKTLLALNNVQNLDQRDATNLTLGTIPAARFGNATVPVAAINTTSGTASATTFLRGDGTWGTPTAALPNINSNTILGNATAGSAPPTGLTSAQVKTLLALSKADVGLNNVDNTTDASKNVASAVKLATARTINGVAFDGSANITIPSSYSLPTASASILGGVKVGSGLAIDAGGVLSATGSGAAANLSSGTITPTAYQINNSNGTGITLPVAEPSVSGSGGKAGLIGATDKEKLDKIAVINPATDANKVLTVKADGSSATWVTAAAGGGGGALQIYEPKKGDGTANTTSKFLVRATGPGVTCTMTGSTVVITIPNGIQLDYFKIRTSTAELGSSTPVTFQVTGLLSAATSGIDNIVVPTATVGSPNGGFDLIKSVNTQTYSQFVDSYLNGTLTMRIFNNTDTGAGGFYVMLRF